MTIVFIIVRGTCRLLSVLSLQYSNIIGLLIDDFGAVVFLDMKLL